MKNCNFKNLTNQTFGYLTCISIDTTKTTSKHTYWLCKCICGKKRSLQTYQLTSGKVTSCGCKNTRRLKVPQSQKRLYGIYNSMLSRCYKQNNISYKYYGLKGITVCDEWKNSFSSFSDWALNNGYTDTLSIDRIDNSLGYCPTNCRWIPLQDQQANKTTSVFYTYHEQTHNLKEWCNILGVPYSKAKDRRKYAKRIGKEPTFDYVFGDVL